jgi:transcriptional regulator with XRE-family HTH domain
VSIGDALAAARREAGLTITQVSQRTCIRETIVRGIERGDYSACGGDFYARGHIRSIARAVGLEPEELIREYDATQAPSQPITAADVFQPYTPVKLKDRRRPNWSVVLLIGLVAVLGIVGFRYFGSHSPQAPSRTAASTQTDHKAKKPDAAKPVAHPTAKHVRLTLLASPGSVSWAQLTSASGKVLFLGDVGGAAVGKISRTESDPITLQLGNPGGVTVYLNGKKQSMEQTNPIRLTCTTQICKP